MNIDFSFSNGVSNFSKSFDNTGLLPFDLEVKTGGKRSRMTSLAGYIGSIDYLFRGVVNQAALEITGVSIENSWYGTISRNLLAVNWDCYFSKTYTVIYDMRKDVINERYYAANSVNKCEDGSLDFNWQLDLFKAPSSTVRENILNSIGVFNDFIKSHYLSWDNTLGLVLKTKDGVVISSENVKDDEIYIALKLIALLVNKPVHLGVFLFDCDRFSENGINLVLAIIKEFFEDTFIFLYNCSEGYGIPRNKVLLPNYIIQEIPATELTCIDESEKVEKQD